MYLGDRKRYNELEVIAADFIEDYDVASFPISPIGLLRQMRIPVKSYRELLDERTISVARKVSPDAFHIAPPTYDIRRMGVYYDAKRDIDRQRMNAAHELAHILCMHPSHEEPFESEAKYLASYLVAPTPLVIAKDAVSIDGVMSTFGVSRECARIRADNAQKRIEIGGIWMEHELRILETCREWLGGDYPRFV